MAPFWSMAKCTTRQVGLFGCRQRFLPLITAVLRWLRLLIHRTAKTMYTLTR